MFSFKEWVEQKKELFLSEMPFLNKVKKSDGWSEQQIQQLWELSEGSRKKIGTLHGEDVFKTSLGSSFCYIFLVKKEKPVFVASFVKIIELGGWQEDLVAKTASLNTVETLYSWLMAYKGFHSIISSNSHSEGMKKVWLQLLKKYEWKAFDDETHEKIEVEHPEKEWSSNVVFKLFLNKKK